MFMAVALALGIALTLGLHLAQAMYRSFRHA
jgi:hypothetical protein